MVCYAEQSNQIGPAKGNLGSRPFCVATLAGSFIGDILMSKRIPLSQGQFAIVDDEYYEWLNQWKWHALWSPKVKSYYAVRNVGIGKKRTVVSMHREILGLKKGDKKQTDHANHKTLDNRTSNIRIVTPQQNQWNRICRGYFFRHNRYLAYITKNYKTIYLGSYETAKEAHNVYLEAKKIHHKI